MFENPRATENYVAVIDIGSNSVRLVVFSGRQRIPDTIFNEKTMVGLGAAIGATGNMAEEAVDAAVSTLKRFNALCDQMGVSDIKVVATAAVRDAQNGTAFVKRVKDECGLIIRVIDGDEEARLAAYGVLSGEPDATGISGDLGGGSLELARMKAGQVHETISLPIGPLRLLSRFGNNRSEIKKYLRKTFAAISWLENDDGHNLYLVGGAWRNITKLMMREKAYPLPILHGFYSSRNEFTAYSRRLSKLSPQDIPFGGTLTSRRREVLPVAATIMIELMRAMKAKKIVASSYGLREGLIYRELPDDDRRDDPFLTACQAIAQERCRFPEHSKLIFDWTRPLFYKKSSDPARRDKRQMAICLLSDVAWRGHPDFRAEKAVNAVLYGHYVGLTHRDRGYIAIALNQAYGAKVDAPHLAQMLPLLKIEDIMEARTMGAALRLAQRLSGGTVKALTVSSLRVSRARLYLGIPEGFSDLANDVVKRRLRDLGQVFGKSARLEFID